MASIMEEAGDRHGICVGRCGWGRHDREASGEWEA